MVNAISVNGAEQVLRLFNLNFLIICFTQCTFFFFTLDLYCRFVCGALSVGRNEQKGKEIFLALTNSGVYLISHQTAFITHQSTNCKLPHRVHHQLLQIIPEKLWGGGGGG